MVATKIAKKSSHTTANKSRVTHARGTHGGTLKPFMPPSQTVKKIAVEAINSGTSKHFTSLRNLEAAKMKRKKAM